MSRSHHGSRTSSLTRRRVLTVAAVGVGASVAGVAGLSLAGAQEENKDDGQALVISLRDAGKGTFDIFSGEERLTFEDPKLARDLLKAVNRA